MTDLVEVLARAALTAEVGGDVWDKLEDKHHTVAKERAARLASALEAAGYRVVPARCTEPMVDAYVDSADAKRAMEDNCHLRWNAMLAAAPKEGDGMSEKTFDEKVRETQEGLRVRWRILRDERDAQLRAVREAYRNEGPEGWPATEAAVRQVYHRYESGEEICRRELIKLECMKERPDGIIELQPATPEMVRRALEVPLAP